MSVKKQILSLSKLYISYEEVPEIFLDETDVDSYFYLKNLDIAMIDNRIVRVTRGSNKKILLSNYFSSFATWKSNKSSLLKRKCQFH